MKVERTAATIYGGVHSIIKICAYIVVQTSWSGPHLQRRGSRIVARFLENETGGIATAKDAADFVFVKWYIGYKAGGDTNLLSDNNV